ncbi:FkbM family methyltransferase [Caenimonas sedimenti]|uniref:FkbM family methyltransferase n=1 Tax=Caenimonas sedimenti TaxID=2596921 RepID=A0A562ZFK5_9BURK|nr:FkbM family methyltransferase [Caenimonas sedimenti]TWO66143.1 FkbM family methyltransferase [Caenimonas sedimenti]
MMTTRARDDGIRHLEARMGRWKLERRTPAVRASRMIHWLFGHVLYPLGIAGATTLARTACRILGADMAVVTNPLGARFAFPAWDSYYGHYFYAGRDYEPEIARLLAAHAANSSASFLDCGANYGYWSVQAARVLQGGVVAVELHPATIALLTINANSAGRPVQVLNAAVWDEDGLAMSVTGTGQHEGHSAQVAEAAGAVRSRTIDSIVSELGLAPEHLLVKVDCEGAEVRALAGAANAAARGACFVLEDHGNDPQCRVSRRVFELGWHLAIFDAQADRWREIGTVDEVSGMKTDPARGYNVMAWAGTLQPALVRAFA